MIIADPSDLVRLEGWGDHESAGRDRREAELVVAYWQGKQAEFGDDAGVAALDLGSAVSRLWSNRFLIAVDSRFERSSLQLYGPAFARLLHLPEQARPDIPMLRQLPQRYADVFSRGCKRSQEEVAPVHLEGEVARYDRRIEQYRAVFIPVGGRPPSRTGFAFGAFNSRVVDAKPAA
jgi:hypothetical protein